MSTGIGSMETSLSFIGPPGPSLGRPSFDRSRHCKDRYPTLIPSKPAIIHGPIALCSTPEQQKQGLEIMTLAELRDEAKRKGLRPRNLRKSELIDLILSSTIDGDSGQLQDKPSTANRRPATSRQGIRPPSPPQAPTPLQRNHPPPPAPSSGPPRARRSLASLGIRGEDDKKIKLAAAAAGRSKRKTRRELLKLNSELEIELRGRFGKFVCLSLGMPILYFNSSICWIAFE